MSGRYLLAIDQGTSSSRAVLYDHDAAAVASAQREFPQVYPRPGWVEHEPDAIWGSVRQVVQQVLAQAGAKASGVTAIGITNQRETTVIWDRKTGQAVHNAIVWQDRRTAEQCEVLRNRGAEPLVAGKTGLTLDPYFSATKIAWLLDNVDGLRQRAARGELAFGTVDSFLLWRLTGGRVHATDATNASRTLLFDIHGQAWDDELLELFDVPGELMPEVRDSACEFGETDAEVFGSVVPVLGIAGDQQAALIGQACSRDGMTKSTFGTGCFVLANTGATAHASRNHLLTTVASRIGNEVTYGLEGSVFVAGSAVQWLRDELGIIGQAPDTERIAAATGVVDDVFVVPAFAGLGAPYWDPHARGAILGLSRGSGRDRIVTATLQAVAFQARDLIDAMADDGVTPSVIRVDGGMVENGWFLQFLADILGIPVERPADIESTVLGAMFLAGIQSGVFGSMDDIAAHWRRDAVFEPAMPESERERLLAGWAEAVARTLTE